MDGLNLVLFLIAAFFGGLTSGVSGFAMGLVVSGVWLHIISPAQNALLIVLCGLVTQGSGIWRVRNAVNWRTVAPFIIGGAMGVPAGTALLKTVDQGTLRLTIGILLILYSLYNLIRPAVKQVHGGVTADLGVGVANGLIGGLTGLGGIAVTIWCQLRGGPKDSAARDLSAGDVRDLRDERNLARGGRRLQC
ncbi:MAG: sulfite exporter TauE/SafE family protein [Pseudolabrys sp.]